MRLIAALLLALPALAQALNSPDGQLQVGVSVNDRRQVVYTVQRVGQPVREEGDSAGYATGRQLVLTLRAANDSLALRHTVDGAGRKTFNNELARFASPANALQPMAAAGSGYNRVGLPDPREVFTDGAGERDFSEAALTAPAATLTIVPRGGFVARFR